MLKLYNTLSRKKEVFRHSKGTRVHLFVCGPTVYDFSHIGHARTYIFFDFFVKYLRSLGYKVFYLQNITDIDDKIIQRAKETGVMPKQLARRFEKEYRQDMKSLGVNAVSQYARATDHVKEIISQVERLLKKGYAYKTSDGIYYDISKCKDYGKLSRRTTSQAEDAVSRIDESVQKRNRGDFCLWKSVQRTKKLEIGNWKLEIAKGEPAWSTPLGWGRPGWHIEDTAITEKFFGAQYDIHGGAQDLIFPHHEAEIAQMEAISGRKPMVKYWLHTGFLTAGGEKMAKSLGNFITIRDFLKEHSPRVLRLFALKSHYRSPIDYSERAVKQTERELDRLDEFVEKLKTQSAKRKTAAQNLKLIEKTKTAFKGALEDDLHTPGAIAAIFDLVHKGNALLAHNKITGEDAKKILRFLKEADAFFQFIFWCKQKKERAPKKVLELIAKREKYRRQKNWQKADEIRNAIKKLGYWLEDTSRGPKLKKIKEPAG